MIGSKVDVMEKHGNCMYLIGYCDIVQHAKVRDEGICS